MMTIYTPKQLQELMSVGRDTAYAIMKEYGFRVGDSRKSPLRITEKGVAQYVEISRCTKGTRMDRVGE